MRRWQGFEFGDQRWVPRFLRRYLHELLTVQTETFYLPLVPKMQQWLKQGGIFQVVDLASGAGGPWGALLPPLRAMFPELQLLHTDLHPPTSKNGGWHPWSVDLRRPSTWPLGGLTLFTGFHHLPPDQALAFLQEVIQQKCPLFLAEFTERRWPRVWGMLLSPLAVWLHTPRVRPASFGRIFFTYFFPLVPLIYLWDGAVSHARTYTAAELTTWMNTLAPVGSQWQVATVPHQTAGLTLTVLTYLPAK